VLNEAIGSAIELFVGLLLLAVIVAVVARPLRLPYTVALVIAGLLVGIGASAAGVATISVSPDLVLLVLLPGLVFEAAYRIRIPELRRWSGGLGRSRRPRPPPRDGAAAGPGVHRRSDAVRD
jgi:NhaP-type Na+/H+ or K+/H+ antiporter